VASGGDAPVILTVSDWKPKGVVSVFQAKILKKGIGTMMAHK